MPPKKRKTTMAMTCGGCGVRQAKGGMSKRLVGGWVFASSRDAHTAAGRMGSTAAVVQLPGRWEQSRGTPGCARVARPVGYTTAPLGFSSPSRCALQRRAPPQPAQAAGEARNGGARQLFWS